MTLFRARAGSIAIPYAGKAQFPAARVYRGLAMLGLGECTDGIDEIRAGGSMGNVAFDAIVGELRALIDKTPCAGEVS